MTFLAPSQHQYKAGVVPSLNNNLVLGVEIQNITPFKFINIIYFNNKNWPGLTFQIWHQIWCVFWKVNLGRQRRPRSIFIFKIYFINKLRGGDVFEILNFDP